MIARRALYGVLGWLSIGLCLWAVNLGAVGAQETPQPMSVDDFEDDDLTNQLGSEWFAYGDNFAGGSSVAEIALTEGASGSRNGLRIAGEVSRDLPFAFAGARSLLDSGGTPKDMSAYRGVRFQARGDDGVYRVQVLSAAVNDHNEYHKAFVAGPEWKLIEVPFAELEQNPYWGAHAAWTAKDVLGVSFQTYDGALGGFGFEVDDIWFY